MHTQTARRGLGKGEYNRLTSRRRGENNRCNKNGKKTGCRKNDSK